MKTKTPGPVEDFLDDICYPDRFQQRQEEDRARRYEAIWDDMSSFPQGWEQQTCDIVAEADFGPVWVYIINQIGPKHIARLCATSRYYPDAMGDVFMTHLSDMVDPTEVGRLIKAAVQQAIDEEVSK